MLRFYSSTLVLSSLLWSIGCSDDNQPVGSTAETGLRAGLVTASDVPVIRFDFTRCGSNEFVASHFVEVGEGEEDVIHQFAGQWFADDATHRFADHFLVLEAGCYTVAVTPFAYNEFNEMIPHSRCAAAQRDAVVLPGQVTDVYLLSQCAGEDPGNLEVAVAINHDPEIRSVSVNSDPVQCGASTLLCVDASDSDGDPLRYSVTLEGDVPCVADAFVGNCATISCSQPGDYSVNVDVFDQIQRYGTWIDIESILAEFGSSVLESRAHTTTHFSVECSNEVTGYTVVGLGNHDVRMRTPFDINNAGEVVGWVSASPESLNSVAFRYVAGTITDVVTPGVEETAFGINDAGVVVGSYVQPGVLQHAYSTLGEWSTDLGALEGNYSQASAINNFGMATGFATKADYAAHAVIFSGGSVTDLGTLGGQSSYGLAINDGGYVVGRSATVEGSEHAFLYNGDTMVDLGTLGGMYSQALAINEAGQVVGSSQLSEVDYSAWRAFLHQGAGMIDLGTLGGSYSFAADINESGVIVGASTTAASEYRAYVYQDGVMIDINTLLDSSANGWVLTVARAINDSGVIVGEGWHHGMREGFIAYPPN